MRPESSAAGGAAGTAGAPGAPGAAGAPIRVLVVDDDPGARALHARFVSEAPGFVVAGVAGSGRAAVEHGIREGIDLVLLDMRLPDVSGVEVLNRLRTLGHSSPDVLVISSSRDQVTVRQALAARVVGYLAKPFTQEVLAARLADYRVERRSARAGAGAGAGAGREERELVLGQGEIDRLASTGRISVTRSGAVTAPMRTPVPKGLSELTLARVVEALDPVEPLSTVELAQRLKISRATARRYLDYLTELGAMDLAHRYGRRGRPEVLYRLVPAVQLPWARRSPS